MPHYYNNRLRAYFMLQAVQRMGSTSLLGVIGVSIGFIAFDYFAGLGAWGRVLGFLIGCIYFSIMDSRLVGGQSIGKKLMKIKLITAKGNFLNLPTAALRYTIIALPIFLNGLPLSPDKLQQSWVAVFLSLCIFGLGLSSLYLIVFNRHTRQSLHDLAVSSYVVNSGNSGSIVREVWKPHFTVVVILFAASVVLPFVTKGMLGSETFQELSTINKAVESVDRVRYAGVTIGEIHSSKSGALKDKNTYIATRAVVDDSSMLTEDMTTAIAKEILSASSSANSKDIIDVTVTYGYDIGIANSWQNKNTRLSPTEWREKIK